MSADAPRTVLSMKWGAKYGADYVNRLYGMVARNLEGPFRFVCLTDDAAGVRPEVECAPIPELPAFPDARERGWKKLAAFSPDLAPLLQGQVLFLDLDLVITGSLAPFFEHPGEFLIIRDWYHQLARIGNSSVFRFRAESRRDVFEAFCADPERAVRGHRNEQEFLTSEVRRDGGLEFWPAAWCRSFRFHCASWPLSYVRTPRPPEGALIIVFHGEPKPPDALAGAPGLLSFRQPAPWIADYWKE